MPPPVKSDALLRYEAFLNGTAEVTDPMRKGALAFLKLAKALSDVLSSQTVLVKGVADDMTIVHGYMSKLNEVVELAGPAAATDGQPYAVFSSTDEDEMYDFRAAFLFAANMGSDPNQYVVYETKDGPPKEYTWKLKISECNTALTNLRHRVDDLGSTSQLEQMKMQTQMNGVNTAIESATAGIEKSGTQSQSVLRSLGRE